MNTQICNGAAVTANTTEARNGALVCAAPSLPVPCGTDAAAAALPIANVFDYLQKRRAVPLFELEERLFDKLPTELRGEVRRMQRAMQFAASLTTGKAPVKVEAACRRALEIYPEFAPLKTFRAKFDAWRKFQDWLVLVNRAKAGAVWQSKLRGLPDAFLEYVAARMGAYGRSDAGEQAILSIHRQWETGRNHQGNPEPIPGYSAKWDERNRALLPDGWGSTNIRTQLKKRDKFNRATKALMHEGIAAARKFLPQVHGTREPLRFLERVQFDDIRCDFRIFDVESGQVNDLWLLIARDVATSMVLGFCMRPARAREDGSQEHLRLVDMKQLTGWMLETYGLTPWLMTWKMERGTATLAQAVAMALEEMLGPDRIHISYSSMIGGRSPVGYAEEALGNSMGKALLESLNRLQHMLTSHFPGQIGLNYGVRPAELQAREREAIEIWKSHQPEDRGELVYPFFTLQQVRPKLFEVFALENNRTQHTMEGFEQVAEWYDAVAGLWKPAHCAPADMADRKVRVRMESPIERGARLLQGCEPFTRVSPEIIIAFYQHTQRRCVVNAKGQIEISIEGKPARFIPPSPEYALPAETKCLGYFNPDQPRFLTLTDARGSIHGAWMRLGLVKDQDSIAAAIRYSAAALRAAKDRAEELSTGRAQELAQMREHNGQFVTVVEPGAKTKTVTSAVADGLASASAEVVREQQKLATLIKHEGAAAAVDILAESERPADEPGPADDFLAVISASTQEQGNDY